MTPIYRLRDDWLALALMNHHNIAGILDVGTTRDGQPYFAMELVQGTPLTTFCDENRLSINERLELFHDVCNGVQHAHQKGIIHRDLKPGNILVSAMDGKPVAKVIDFGLAKAMESTQRLTDQSLFTGIGQILGTLKYMSPEQASLDNLDIDIRTDIYALGVILYELVTGSTPLDDSSIKGNAALKVLEFIRDKEPVKPSSKFSSSTDEQISTITGQRKTDSGRLNRVLSSVGMTLLQLKRFSEAEDLLRECLKIHQETQPDSWKMFDTQSMLGAALLVRSVSVDDDTKKAKLLTGAESLLVDGYEGMKQREASIPPNGATRISEALDRMIELYTILEKPEEAQKYRELRATYPPSAEKR